MKKALEILSLEVLFGIKKPNKHFIPNDLAFSTYMPRIMPTESEWFKKHNVSVLTDKQSTNVPIRVGNNIKWVDLHTIKGL